MKRYGGVSTNVRQMAWICAPEAEKVAETTSVIVRQSLAPIDTTGFDLRASSMLARAGRGKKGLQKIRLSHRGPIGVMRTSSLRYVLVTPAVQASKSRRSEVRREGNELVSMCRAQGPASI